MKAKITKKKSSAQKRPTARFVKLSTTGNELSPGAKSWAQVLDRDTGLIWTADTVKCGRKTHEEAVAAAAAVRIGKRDDWRLPTIKELFSLVDHTRSDPAINTEFFRCESAFYWTDTPLAASPSGGAWLVGFSGGLAYCYYRGGTAFVRAVRVARASQ